MTSTASSVGIREADEQNTPAVAIDRLRDDLAKKLIKSTAIERDLRSLITAYESQAERLREVVALAIPSGLCLTNRNVPDSTVVCIDATMGDLRKIAAALQSRPATSKDQPQ